MYLKCTLCVHTNAWINVTADMTKSVAAFVTKFWNSRFKGYIFVLGTSFVCTKSKHNFSLNLFWKVLILFRWKMRIVHGYRHMSDFLWVGGGGRGLKVGGWAELQLYMLGGISWSPGDDTWSHPRTVQNCPACPGWLFLMYLPVRIPFGLR